MEVYTFKLLAEAEALQRGPKRKKKQSKSESTPSLTSLQKVMCETDALNQYMPDKEPQPKSKLTTTTPLSADDDDNSSELRLECRPTD